jgi:Arc/MetJ family transcription regulator
MRTNIDIDEKLMSEAMKLMGTRTKKETVEKALEAQVAIKVRWTGRVISMNGGVNEARRRHERLDRFLSKPANHTCSKA